MREMAENAAVEVSGVVKNFGKLRALDRVSLAVKRGEIYGLLGPNGSGKTTLIRMLVGLVEADAGTITVLDTTMPSVAILGRVGYMTQQAAVYPDLSVEENVRFFAAVYGAEGGVRDAIDVAELTARRRELVANLSGGMRQRCSLACALVHKPDLLLLDEPTVGVDPALRRQFWDYFRKLADGGAAIIVSSHVMDEAERCDRLGLMRFGKLLAEGSAEQLRKSAKVKNLEDAFLKLSDPTT
jgi:ABC-2 type transport system ATP-binding protein